MAKYKLHIRNGSYALMEVKLGGEQKLAQIQSLKEKTTNSYLSTLFCECQQTSYRVINAFSLSRKILKEGSGREA